jgi:hypothetical protein
MNMTSASHARERVQLGRRALVLAANDDRWRQCLHDGVDAASVELDHRAEHCREGSAAGRRQMKATLAARHAGQLVPIPTREHHKIAAPHGQRLPFAFRMHPRLTAPD